MKRISSSCSRSLMDAITLLQPYNRVFLPPAATMRNCRRRRFLHSVLANNGRDSALSIDQPKTVYNDNWFDRLAINHLSKALQAASGERTKRSGYDGLVETATKITRRFNPIQQREIALGALDTAFPKAMLSMVKVLLPKSKFARESSALFTTIFFSWLVGPCKVTDSEFEGRTEKNIVHIPKCRLLEESNCVGMCTNLCKMPCQSFIKNSVGIPVNMIPNFEDMNCEMIFGEEPPPQSLDPALKQPCFKQCKVKRKHGGSCPL